MIAAQDFFSALKAYHYRFFCGVPCSYLTPLINATISDETLTYVGATNEGEAVAMALGARVAGVPSVFMCQNSGLGNGVSPLTSLAEPFRIPLLCIVTWRGEDQRHAEPQHEKMGQITHDLITLMGLGMCPFPKKKEDIVPCLHKAEQHYKTHATPFVLVMSQGDVKKETLREKAWRARPKGHIHDFRERKESVPSRFETLRHVRAIVPRHCPLIATTGKCGRELFTIEDHDAHFYQVGAMGYASAFAFGVALHTERDVIVLDGDGAALMHMGSMATIGAYAPPHYTHIVLDNACHDSTGGQSTISPMIDFCAIAQACGYRHIYQSDSLASLETCYTHRQACRHSGQEGAQGPAFIHMRIQAGSIAPLGRPSVDTPSLAKRFSAFLQQTA
ncbi:MAG: phosphonopyruvate decarboxylase [Alphaproteobacteria bacterium GM7ARS4]|nr:phosphonopyruvate decarboxylase [Alphaproteobacteria bacterium GM7ARS4]